MGRDSLNTRRTLTVGEKDYDYFALSALADDVRRLPFSLKVVLENLLRYEDGRAVTTEDVAAMAAWLADGRSTREIAYRPARVLLQDFTGVPALVDLAAIPTASTRSRRWISSSTIR